MDFFNDSFDKSFKRMQWIAVFWILVVLTLGLGVLFIIAKYLGVI